ncbi:MAG: hypothetical protein ABR576_13005 [Thermoanaerobaculia bacterium]
MHPFFRWWHVATAGVLGLAFLGCSGIALAATLSPAVLVSGPTDPAFVALFAAKALLTFLLAYRIFVAKRRTH